MLNFLASSRKFVETGLGCRHDADASYQDEEVLRDFLTR
jgi:hypothetical protein